MKGAFSIILLLLSFFSFGQDKSSQTDSTAVFHSVDQMPQFPEQYGSVNEFLSQHIVYPDSARLNGIEGKVIVQFVVGEDGSILHPQVARGIGYGCDEATLKAFMEMPKWIPGRKDGKAVKVYYMVPVAFTLKDVTLDSVVENLSHPRHDTIYHNVEKMPEFPGGRTAMYSYLSKNIKYPEKSRERGIEGTVYVEFVVDTDGSITDIKVTGSVDYYCDAEAVRAIKKMPKWKPGRQKGKNVRVYYLLPVSFKLSDF